MNVCQQLKRALWPAPRSRRLRRHAFSTMPCAAEVEMLERRSLLSSVAITTSGGNITLQAADNGDHVVQLARINANTIQVTSANGTQFTLNGSGAAAQENLNISKVTGITINTGKGLEDFTIQDVSVQGNVIFNGDVGAPTLVSGSLTIRATTADVAITGLVIANYGNEAADFSLNALTGNVTVNGPVIVHSGKGAINSLFANIQSNNGHTAWLKCGLNVTSTGASSTVFVNSHNAQSQTIVDGGVFDSMSGDISFTGDKQGSVTVNGPVTMLGGPGSDYLGFYGKTHVTGAVLFTGQNSDDVFECTAASFNNVTSPPVIDGPVTFLPGGGANNIVNIQADDPLHPITFKSSFTVVSGFCSDEFIARNVDFLGSLTIIQGSNPAANVLPDTIAIDGVTVAGPAYFSSQGHKAVYRIANNSNPTTRETVFKSSVTILATGPSSQLKLSNANAGTPLHFKGALIVIGGFPNAQLTKGGAIEFDPAKVLLIGVNGSL